jgi:hypothetical protein
MFLSFPPFYDGYRILAGQPLQNRDLEENGKQLMVNRCRQNCFRIQFRKLLFQQQCHTTDSYPE